MSPESILHALLRMARCVFAADHETGTASSARSRVWLALVLLATAASCANDCDGCSCKGSSDVERQRASSARQEPEPSGQATEDPSEEPTADPQNEHAAPTGASGGSGSPFALDERDDPALAAAAGGTTLDRPTSGQVGVVLRDLRARAEECSRGVRRSVVVELTISGRSGRATSARAVGPSAGTPEAACVESLMREAQFPTFARPEMRTAYAYRLPGVDPDGGAAAGAIGDAGSGALDAAAEDGGAADGG